MNETILTTVVGIILAAAIIAIAKHLSNSDRHPNKKDIVFREICKKTQDCLESKIDGLQKLCTNEFKHIKELIKNDGQEPPRVQT